MGETHPEGMKLDSSFISPEISMEGAELHRKGGDNKYLTCVVQHRHRQKTCM